MIGHLSPKGTTIAWDEDHLAFADIFSPGTTSNLLINPAMEINVVDVRIIPLMSHVYDYFSELEITGRWIEYWNTIYH